MMLRIAALACSNAGLPILEVVAAFDALKREAQDFNKLSFVLARFSRLAPRPFPTTDQRPHV
jgi:hypothetical protein